MRIDEALAQAAKHISEAHQDLTRSEVTAESRLLLGLTLNKTVTWLLTWPEKILSPDEKTQFFARVNARSEGQPIAYILGEKPFWDITLQVNPHTLIPRPETELLVEKALTALPKNVETSVLELGTGSGCIALAIARARPKANIIATDLSLEALAVAKNNARSLGIENVSFLISDWYQSLDTALKCDGIISNPPYLAKDDPHLNNGDLRFEPKQALSDGADGLQALKKIISGARKYLKRPGFCWVEHGYQQGAQVRGLFQEAGFNSIATHQDIAANDRVTGGRLLD